MKKSTYEAVYKTIHTHDWILSRIVELLEIAPTGLNKDSLRRIIKCGHKTLAEHIVVLIDAGVVAYIGQAQSRVACLTKHRKLAAANLAETLAVEERRRRDKSNARNRIRGVAPADIEDLPPQCVRVIPADMAPRFKGGITSVWALGAQS